MSYILEALKRADAERDRGAVPTLHSHAIPAAAKAPPRTPVANWIAGVAVLALVAGAALWWTQGRQPAPAVVLAPAPTPPVAAVAPAAAPTPATPAPASAAPTPATTMASPPAAAAPARPAPNATPRKAAEPPRAVAARPAASGTAPTAATAPAVVAAPPVARPASAAAPQGVIYNVAELPDDIRAQLPKLSISGATYSAQAAYRMLIVNGQVLHEGDEPGPGLTLETIRQKDVVLRFKGYRYSVGY